MATKEMPPRKDTYVWADEAIVSRLYDYCDGCWFWKCECGVPHRHVRGTHQVEERDLACAYPRPLCDELAKMAKQIAKKSD